MEYNIRAHKLVFKHPFKIAHTTRTHTLGAYLEITDGQFKGKGEIVFPPYYPENLASFTKFLMQVDLPDNLSNFDINSYLRKIDKNSVGNKFALAAMDMALHNLVADYKNTSIRDIYQVTGRNKPTSFTIGISTDEEMRKKIESVEPFEYVKLKVDQNNIKRIVSTFQELCDKSFVIDANQGFKSKEAALEWSIELNNLGVAYLEQPFQKDDLNSHKWLSERSPIPIIADESFQTIEDIEKLKDSFKGINVKLMKCGGILQAHECLKSAKEHDLKTVLGCMSESSVAIDTATNLSPLADWVDLDGPFLIKEITPM
jgi:L-alanine-DL-glutamate epimerase-like enolase superfamily enzyme